MSKNVYLQDNYIVRYNGEIVGYYQVMSDGRAYYNLAWGMPGELEAELKELGLAQKREGAKSFKPFTELICDENRVPGRRRILYRSGPVLLERKPRETGERYMVYRRSAEQDAPDYSPLPHDAPHWEGPKTPDGMREWASWYAFNKMDDGTYEAELDEAWWWGGGHNDGGTIHTEIPEEWLELPYEDFLAKVVTLAAAAHYGFTPELLLARPGLREFFGYPAAL